MIGVGSPSRIFLYRGTTDMRKGYDGLSGIIRGELSNDPMNGTLFVFLNRPRNMVKALYWDRDGFALWSKRLERGRFAPPQGERRRDRMGGAFAPSRRGECAHRAAKSAMGES